MRALFPHIASAVAVLVAAAPASAYTISGTYYEDQIPVTCTAVSSCSYAFFLPSALTGKLLTITSLSCRGSVTRPLGTGRMEISDGGSNPRRAQSLTMDQTPTTGGLVSWREPVEMKVTGGPPRQIDLYFTFDNTTNVSMNCAIVGVISNN